MSTKFDPENTNEYICLNCDFICSKKSAWARHIITRKHNRQQQSTKKTPMLTIFKCVNCNKEYKERTGLWKHSKKCNINNINNILDNNNDNLNDTNNTKEEQLQLVIKDLIQPLQNKISLFESDVITELIKQNHDTQKQSQDFQKQNIEFQQQMFTQIMEMMKTSLTTNNIVNGNVSNNYNQFNLQVYLNETCKNSMTINQFLDYLEPTIEELEATAHLGYVEGISRIIMRGFKNLEEHELPFHCSDLKREHIYVKNPDDEWVEETDEKPLLLRFIKEVARKNFNNVAEWQKKNPQWANYHSKQNDMFMKILNNSMSGGTEEEQQANYEKIMKNIMKNTVIDKSKKNKCK